MLISSIQSVVFITAKTDFRKRFDGLLAEAYRLGFDPYQGSCLVFVKTDRTQLRVLYGDGYGLYLLCRRFEGSRFRIPGNFITPQLQKTISLGELAFILEGATFNVVRHVKRWKK
ncbi:MAG: IS66 family insertion sequence element accessory protein TnpB [Oligoflexus sp.]|jgi:hypothetical protein